MHHFTTPGRYCACLQRFSFLCSSSGCTLQPEREGRKASDNDADYEHKKDYDGKRRAEFPRKKRGRDRNCILNGKMTTAAMARIAMISKSIRRHPLNDSAGFEKA
jgi:hypothetical protein